MEMENHYASKGVGGTALGLSIGALGAELLGGTFGNILGGGNRMVCSEDHFVNRYEAEQAAKIANLETEVKLRDANTYTDSKLLELYKYVDGKFAAVEHELCDQRTYNAVNTTNICCIRNDVAALMALTKTVIPAANICPAPMPMYNSWTAPTAPATTG